MADKKYDEMKQRDILIEVSVSQIAMKETMDKTFVRLEAADETLHGRISDVRKEADEKIKGVHERVDKIRWWSIASGGIGGMIGAFLGALGIGNKG